MIFIIAAIDLKLRFEVNYEKVLKRELLASD